jgi:hypothetical protein
MKAPDEAWWARAHQARDQLVAQFFRHPAVYMIDIGADPQGTSDTPVLRIHISRGHPAPADLPGAVDSIPVRVIAGDYQLQRGSSAV